MRNHNLILRQIARDNLDPKIPYVAGKNGKLVVRARKEEVKSISDETETDATTVQSENPKIESHEDFIVPEGAKSIPESLEEESVISKDSGIAKKKTFPTKKKSKVEFTSE